MKIKIQRVLFWCLCWILQLIHFVFGLTYHTPEDSEVLKKMHGLVDKDTEEVNLVVRALLAKHPELAPEKFGLKDSISPMTLFKTWQSAYLMAKRYARLRLQSKAKSMEFLANGTIQVTNSEGSFPDIPHSTVVDEIRRYVRPEDPNDCEKLASWLHIAFTSHKKLGDFGVENDLDAWK